MNTFRIHFEYISYIKEISKTKSKTAEQNKSVVTADSQT